MFLAACLSTSSDPCHKNRFKERTHPRCFRTENTNDVHTTYLHLPLEVPPRHPLPRHLLGPGVRVQGASAVAVPLPPPVEAAVGRGADPGVEDDALAVSSPLGPQERGEGPVMQCVD